MISDRTRNIVVWVVTAIWAINFTLGAINPNYRTSESVNGIFTAIVGGAFAASAIKRGDGNGKDDKDA